MADFRKLILYFGLALVVFLLWSAWEREHAPQPSDQKKIVKTTEPNQKNMIPVQKTEQFPSSSTGSGSTVPVTLESANKHMIPKDRLVHVKTDVLDVLIDKMGGNIVQLNLIKYPVSLKSKEPVSLFNAVHFEDKHYSLGVSGIISAQGPDTQTQKGVYESEKNEYVFLSSQMQDELIVSLLWKHPNGLVIEKKFLFEHGKYSIKVTHEVRNQTNTPWSGNFYAEIKQKEPESASDSMALSAFQGASLSTAEDNYQKISFKTMRKADIRETTKGGWLAFQKRYFLTSWIPPQDQNNLYYTRINDKLYTIGVVGPEISLKPGEKKETNATLYAGPKITKNLKPLAPYLDLTIDYGWLWFIAGPIFFVMDQIHKWVGNWGVSIILITLLIKLAFYHLSATSYRSTAKMQKLTPLLQRIREQYKDDRQKMSQETMALYRREKVNPLAGCLPIIVQIPFFFALYYVLIESVELRQAPFILWIQDLSSKDPYYVLPILMGISMFVQQKLNPMPVDPMQAKIMMFMPLMFTVFFLNFPAGLVLYWLTNNCLSILQQWWITRTVSNKK